MSQEWIALSIVALSAGALAWRGFRLALAGPLAGWLLRRGRVGLAMRLRRKSAGAETCGSCSCDS